MSGKAGWHAQSVVSYTSIPDRTISSPYSGVNQAFSWMFILGASESPIYVNSSLQDPPQMHNLLKAYTERQLVGDKSGY